MSNSSTKKQRARSKALASKNISHCTELVLVDSEPLREKVWHAYQTALKKFEKAARDLQQFTGMDQDRYRLWYEGEFGREIIQLQKSRGAVAELTDWMEQIEAYAEYKDVSLGESLRILEAVKGKGKLEEFWSEVVREIEVDEERERQARHRNTQGRSRKKVEEDFERIFDEAKEEFYGGVLKEKDERDEGLERSLKELYHKLALRLHPDTNPLQNDEEKELFQRVQEAYRDKDVEGLEEVWKRVEGGGVEVFSWKTAAIGEIIRRKKALDLRTRDLGAELKYAKAHPAWEFSKTIKNKTALSSLRLKLRNGLLKEQAQLDAIWLELNEQLQAVERVSRKTGKRGPKVKPKT
jgi:hypothetical protein